MLVMMYIPFYLYTFVTLSVAKKKVSFFDKVKNFFKGIGKYFKDTKSELKKVVWPSKNDVKTNTITVIVVVLVAAVVLILLDLIFGGAIHLLIGA